MKQSHPSHIVVAAVYCHCAGSRRWHLKTYKCTSSVINTRKPSIDVVLITLALTIKAIILTDCEFLASSHLFTVPFQVYFSATVP